MSGLQGLDVTGYIGTAEPAWDRNYLTGSFSRYFFLSLDGVSSCGVTRGMYVEPGTAHTVHAFAGSRLARHHHHS